MNERMESGLEFNLPESYHALVLLVDDQPFVSEAVRRAFKDQPDISYHYCADPKEAIEMANYLRPTVILLDLVMPGVGGLQLLEQFRHNPDTRETPIVMLSSREEARAKSESFALGANDYLVKLPDTVELRARVRYHSQAHLHRLQRNAAFRALQESQQQMLRKNTELAILNQDFRLALSELREVEALLPICVSCNEPRKDLVYRERLREYFSKQTGLSSVHQKCESCQYMSGGGI